MATKTLQNILKKLDGYLISIKRNLDTSMYELEVGFRKNWTFKSTDDIECEILDEFDDGTIVKIYGKHDEVIVDDLIIFINKVIDTNKKITEMQEKFDEELEEQKTEIANKILEFDQSILDFKDSSFDDDNEEEKESSETKEDVIVEKTT